MGERERGGEQIIGGTTGETLRPLLGESLLRLMALDNLRRFSLAAMKKYPFRGDRSASSTTVAAEVPGGFMDSHIFVTLGDLIDPVMRTARD